MISYCPIEIKCVKFADGVSYPACACMSRGLCDRGWCPTPYIIMFVDEKIFESYFSDRLTFSNIRSRTSR